MIYEIPLASLPQSLQNIPNPPRQLYVRASNDAVFDALMKRPRVAIVGSRKMSDYGKAVTAQLASELAAQGVVIISGLALGIDAIAHRAALDANGTVMAVLPTPVERIYPRTNDRLAFELLESGGALVSEYANGTDVYKTNFVARNRIVSGLTNALPITEAAEGSGTLHTAQFAIDQGVDVLALPGNVTSETSVGTNNLIKTGAIAITNTDDILLALGLNMRDQNGAKKSRIMGSNAQEQQLINLLEQGISEGSELLSASALSVQQFNHHLTMLEITSKIRSLGANRWALR
jgi:DNA processing protein